MDEHVSHRVPEHGNDQKEGVAAQADHDPAPNFAEFVLSDHSWDSPTSSDLGSGEGRGFAARVIEAVLMVATDPVPPQFLADLLELSVVEVEEVAEDLAASYELEERGFCMKRVAGGYRYESHPELSAYVERFVLEGTHARMSQAALETLAIVAYKQPVSRGQLAAIRGVNVEGVLRNLVQKGYVTEVGRYPGPGQAALYGTTDQFLESLGLDRIENLPDLGDFVPSSHLVEALERGLLADPEADPRAMRVFPPVEAPHLQLNLEKGAVPPSAAPDVSLPDVSVPFAYIEPEPTGPTLYEAGLESTVSRPSPGSFRDESSAEHSDSPPARFEASEDVIECQPLSAPDPSNRTE